MNKDKIALIRIRKEIEVELSAVKRVKEDYQSIPHDLVTWIKVRTKASLLHDFYTGIEKIFSRIAQELNGGLPNSEQWHRDLLKDMTLELEDIRPPVISEELYKDLLPYLRFRHLFRNLYGFELEWEKMEDLDKGFEKISKLFFEEIDVFLGWLKETAQL